MPEWSLVGGDPAPGEPGLIRELAGAIGQTATDAQEARIALDTVSCEATTCGWEGEGAVAFADAFAPLPPELGLMARSYDSVSTALNRYADQLEAIQAEAEQALVRAQLAAERERAASRQLDAARERLGALRRQLDVVQQDEAYYLDVQATRRATGGVDCGEDAALARAQANRCTIQVTLGTAETDESSALRARSGARADLASARRRVVGLRCDREAAERATATAITEALADCLRNRDAVGRFMDGLREVADGLGAMAGAAEDLLLDLVAQIHDVLTFLEEATFVMMIACFVATAACLVLSAFVPALAPVLLPLAVSALQASVTVAEVNTLITATRVASGAVLYAHRHPRANDDMVDGSDLVVDAAFLAVPAAGRRWVTGAWRGQGDRHLGAMLRSGGATGEVGRVARDIAPPTRDRVDAWGARQGFDTDGPLWHGGRATIDLAEPWQTNETSDWLRERLERPSERADAFRAGGGVPVVRGCYAAPAVTAPDPRRGP